MTRAWPVLVVFTVVLSACAPRALRLPEGPGTPFDGYAQAFATATDACRGARTLTAELGVSGEVGGNRVRGRVLAGFERPNRIRLEGVAPFGPPAFILAANDASATLLLPRGSRVLSDVPPEQILEALIGITLRPADLQAALDGCVVPDPKPVAGHAYAGGWVRVELEGGSSAYLKQQDGNWVVRAGRLPLWAIEYTRGTGRLPTEVRLRSAANGGPGSHLRLTVGQVEINVAVDPAAFTVRVPKDATPITLHELRQIGPLGEGR